MTNQELETMVAELERKQQDLQETIKVLSTENKALSDSVVTLEIRVKDLFKLTS